MSKVAKTSVGFTLIELLVVVAIVSLLAAILMPVFATARERARQTVCLSNQRQMAMAFDQYTQDYDGVFPNGLNRVVDGDEGGSGPATQGFYWIWPGEGWAGQVSPYVKSVSVYACPDDPTRGDGPFNSVVSYGYNINLAGDGYTPVLQANLSNPARTVALFEVAGVTVNLLDPAEGGEPGGMQGDNFSASANGLDNRLYAQKTGETLLDNTYATGYLGGRVPPDPGQSQFLYSLGRHSTGSNYLLTDGHVRWLLGERISSGLVPQREDCNESNMPPVSGCSGAFIASGTASTGNFTATFSPL